jgi:hypothetical protein
MKIFLRIAFYLFCCNTEIIAQTKDTFLFQDIPIKVRTNVETLTEAICNAADKDETRVQNIYYWITHYIAIDVSDYNKGRIARNRLPSAILKSRDGDTDDFAVLMKAMCESSGIACQIIPGYEKDELYDNGAGFYKPNHTWNAVLVNNKWEIVDAYHGAGDIEMNLSWMKKQLQKVNTKKLYTTTKIKFKQNYHPEYFLQDPEEVRLTRLPVDPIWQLTDTLMPLHVFEKIEEDIQQFNEQFSELKKFSLQLSEVNKWSEDQQIINCADRTFAFNPRYTEMKAKKHLALANTEIKKLNYSDLQKVEKDSIVRKARAETALCKNYLLLQKGEIAKEYNELQKVNSEKRLDVMRYKQKFSGVNTTFIVQCETKLSALPNKKKSWERKASAKGTAVISNWDKIRTQNPEAKETLLEGVNMKDSIESRSKQIDELTNTIKRTNSKIEILKADQAESLDLLWYHMHLADSAFYKEAVARSKRHDSFDDSIKMIRSALYYHKIAMVDSLQKLFFKRYDSVVHQTDSVAYKYSKLMDLCKENRKDLEAYKRYRALEQGMEERYFALTAMQKESENGLYELMRRSIYYLQTHKPVLTTMKRVYTKENKYFNYLMDTEDERKKFVKKVLEKNEKLEKKRNQVNLDNLKDGK